MNRGCSLLLSPPPAPRRPALPRRARAAAALRTAPHGCLEEALPGNELVQEGTLTPLPLASRLQNALTGTIPAGLLNVTRSFTFYLSVCDNLLSGRQLPQAQPNPQTQPLKPQNPKPKAQNPKPKKNPQNPKPKTPEQASSTSSMRPGDRAGRQALPGNHF